jgi:hypothetical protein
MTEAAGKHAGCGEDEHRLGWNRRALDPPMGIESGGKQACGDHSAENADECDEQHSVGQAVMRDGERLLED